MSDKSFGDHANRNIVKNPLLSTAVTGLLLEDLTHNAVLVPVAPNQGLIGRSDAQPGAYNQPLQHTDHENINLPSGDSNPNIIPSQPTIPMHPMHLEPSKPNNPPINYNKIEEISTATVLKADDDFDVNEYFARLQGTRYVSAPLHSNPDQNANIEAEENLEEINLNEEKAEVQQSLTADLAQNFSQLPTVLPHVASAVFSSFSNMLNLKREVPDGRMEVGMKEPAYKQDYQEVMFDPVAIPEVPLSTVAKEVAPPPKEIPTQGTSNFRITTRKKYAQIPGLSSGEPRQITFNPLAQNIPSYFTPASDNIENAPTIQGLPNEKLANQNFNIHHPIEANTNSNNVFDYIKAKAGDTQPNAYDIPEETKTKSFEDVPEQSQVIPPPPMFSAPKTETQGAKSVLPPSVARRIGSNQPVIKSQVITSTATENIFVPTFDPTPQAQINPSFSYEPTNQQSVNTAKLQTQQVNVTNLAANTPIGFPPQQNISTSNVSTIPPPMFAPMPPPASNIFVPQVQSGPESVSSFALPVNQPVYPTSQSQTNVGQSFAAAAPPPMFAPTATEPPKHLVEPPKALGNQSFRMAKKRPQYYSGPIEGVGAISNNIKPVIPPVDTGSFQGALFTPEQGNNQPASEPVPFDISRPAEVPQFDINPPTQAITSFDINNQPTYSQFENSNTQSYNTAFDFSRATTESYEQESKDNTGFGIIGSLKSKLSNLDINKIQNSVTHFFDPVYNDTKKDVPTAVENVPQVHANQTAFEIFVPVQYNAQSYDHNNSQNYHDHYYQNQYNYYQNNDPNFSSYYSSPTYSTQPHTEPTTYQPDAENIETKEIIYDDNVNKKLENNENVTKILEDIPIIEPEENEQEPVSQFFDNINPGSFHTEPIKPPEPVGKPQDFKDTFVPTTYSADNKTEIDNMKPFNLFSGTSNTESSNIEANKLTNIPTETVQKPFGMFPPKTEIFRNEALTAPMAAKIPDIKEFEVKSELLKSLSKEELPILGVSSEPLFGLSAIIPEKSKDKDVKIFNPPILEHNSSLSFFDNPLNQPVFNPLDPMAPVHEAFAKFAETVPEKQLQSLFDSLYSKDNIPNENVGEILSRPSVVSIGLTQPLNENLTAFEEKFANIHNVDCVKDDKPAVKETESTEEISTSDDVTAKMIENLTSALQLANPVTAPFFESAGNNRVGFNVDQYNKISNITEETIENIQGQAASELLEKNNPIYGWPQYYSDDNNDYSFKIDPNTAGFYGNNSLFFDNVPTNASDELKAEYKHQDDILPRQMSIPTAPPAEDDQKTDESGHLDVNSIELDAKKDFPIDEEFVIEPSETDDDKIEYKEKEKSDDADFDIKNQDATKPAFFEMPSQAISMASYFDTGNYAADTYYKNILTSGPVSIPPGFEEEFKNKLALAKTKADDKSKIVHKLDAFAQNTSYMDVGFNVESNVAKIVADTPEILSDCSNIFGQKINVTEQPAFTQNVNKQEIGTKTEISHENITPEAVFSKTVESKDEPATQVSSIFGQNTDIKETASTVDDTAKPSMFVAFSGPAQDKNESKLPDPKHFFADTPEASESFNRLASYFSSPPKTEHAKSFFELSQSQNHYRHANENKYTSLMNDLTSVPNIVVTKDQTIRHVNFFTVEYDTKALFDKGDVEKADNENNDIDTFDVNSVISNCWYCANVVFDKNFVVRTAVNQDSEGGRGNPNMGSNKDQNRDSVSLNFSGFGIHEETNQESVAGATENRSAIEYTPVNHHWFYRVDIEDKSIWRGFSFVDSTALENTFMSPELNETTVVATDGGRFDVNIMGRLRIPVYWNEKPTNVRRCSWFYKGTTDARYVPYTEPVAEKLEEEYRHGVSTGEWHRRLVLPNGEIVVMHGPSVMVHFLHSDAFSSPPLFSFGKRVYRNPPKIRVAKDQPMKIDHLILLVHGAGEYRSQKEKSQSTSRPRVVRRGYDESEIEDSEPSSIDHLLLLCHGVGSACDMRFRSVEEVVEDFRTTSLQLIQSHYRNSYDEGVVSRVEVLPISWHATLHSGETGVDRRLAQITLDSIPRLRSFTNDTVLDVLFYTSPVFCQTIVDTVCNEMNRIYSLFVQRNPSFVGGVSLGGHSLGSVILYDLLSHQPKPEELDKTDKQYVSGPAGSGQPSVLYPSLVFRPDALYALGSPIAIFECIRGVETLGLDFSLPTCKNFFNIFHPYDPIAYRIEPLVNPKLKDLKPFLIPHHKGRKRMHLELKDTMARVGADIKQKLVDSLRSTWNKWKATPTDGSLEKVVEEDIEREPLNNENKLDLAKERELSTPAMLGSLNSGRRVDYVLQEAPLEMINEYLFAMSSHVGYWESEDTMLLMLREIYNSLGVQPDSTVPQANMSVPRTRKQQSPTSTTIMKNSDLPSTSHDTT